MIQRIQSLYLLVGGLFFLGNMLLWFRTTGGSQDVPAIAAAVLQALTGLGLLGTIFLYGNREKQHRVVTMVQYLALGAILVSFGGLYLGGALETWTTTDLVTPAMILLPVLGYLLSRMAAGRIRKDIELVRSMDRLR